VTALDLIEGQQQGGNAIGRGPPVREPLKVIHSQLNATCKVTNAARCLGEFASVIVPARYFGAHRIHANTGASSKSICGHHGGSHELPAHLAPALEHLTQRQPHGAALRRPPLCGAGGLFA